MRHQNHAPAAGKRCKRPAVSSCFVTVIGLWLVLPAVDCLAQAPPVLSAPQPELSTLIDLQASELTESSGIAELNGQLWTHNDSGDQPRLFAFDLSGQLLAQVTVSGEYLCNRTPRRLAKIARQESMPETPHNRYVSSDLSDRGGQQ